MDFIVVCHDPQSYEHKYFGPFFYTAQAKKWIEKYHNCHSIHTVEQINQINSLIQEKLVEECFNDWEKE